MTAARRAPIELYGAFESTYQPAHDIDVVETTQHDLRWEADLTLLHDLGVDRLRYPIRWHRIERQRGIFDWRETDRILGWMRDHDMRPAVDLVHHTSYPLWIGDFSNPSVGPAMVRYATAFAERYPWIEEYTLFNEPFTTFFLCGLEGLWPPRLKGLEGFVQLATNVLPWVAEASRVLHERLPAARHLYVEVCEHADAVSAAGQELADYANDRRFLLTDLFVGRPVDRDRPFAADVLRAGGAELLDMEPGRVDVLGLDYYAHNQWQYGGPGGEINSSPNPLPLADVIVQYWDRYQLPCMLGETNIRGFASDRATWLKYTLEQCEQARDAGVPFTGYCWFPTIDSADWDSLLFNAVGNVDPVGVFWLDERLERRHSWMSAAYALIALGGTSADLPAYRLRSPVADWLSGWMPHMAHWCWRDPPAQELCSQKDRSDDRIELRIPDDA